jgi:endonuclease III
MRAKPVSIAPRAKPGQRASLTIGLSRLERHYGRVLSLAPAHPFELLIWEYVAYLTDDADRAAAFLMLKKRVGTDPTALAEASPAVLEAICRAGGAIAFNLRAQRIHDVAVRVRDRFKASLDSVLRLPYPEARRILKTFPAIGPPGADKILLLTGAHKILALDSNALRVLLRLGYGDERKSYSASYASAQKAALEELPRSVRALQKASLLLRRHGQELCRRTDPRCPICPLRDHCAFARLK